MTVRLEVDDFITFRGYLWDEGESSVCPFELSLEDSLKASFDKRQKNRGGE